MKPATRSTRPAIRARRAVASAKAFDASPARRSGIDPSKADTSAIRFRAKAVRSRIHGRRSHRSTPAVVAERPELVRHEAERRHEEDRNGLRLDVVGSRFDEHEQAERVRTEGQS